MNVLVVSSDTKSRERIAVLLRGEGIDVVVSSSPPNALAEDRRGHPDVVVLELGESPDVCLDLLRRIRAVDPVPVLVLTDARNSAASETTFNLGADAHLTTPVGSRELAVRIHAIHRRSEWMHPSRAEQVVIVGGLRLKPATGEALVNGQPVHLTPRESRIVHLLALNPGKIVPISQLLRYVWAPEDGDVNSLRAHLSHVRTKLADGSVRISAERGVGYRLHDLSAGAATASD